jgi:magnesium chelatase family protein
MSLAVVCSRALDGLRAPRVRVEVHLANGLPSFTLVGLADTEVKEARERVRAALLQGGFDFPHNKRVIVNLAPADLPKESGRFDLPIALGVLAAQGLLDPARLAAHEFAGELSLAGDLRPVRGALALALGVQEDGGAQALVLPAVSAGEAAHVEGIDVRAASTLAEVVAALRPGAGEVALPRALPAAFGARGAAEPPPPDLADVRGQLEARRALEIAAAGGHSLLLVGPPGAGKSMLAERLPGLLPPMSAPEALASAALHSVSAHGLDPRGFGRRPLRTPHHSASAVALVGGGSPPRPGEISLAHGGVLFLDELPEFPRAALEALREPLETGCITISRAARQASYPARFQLVAAMNPCPCGWLGTPPGQGRACRCSPDTIARYQARLSGPLLDRIDMQVEVAALKASALMPGHEERGAEGGAADRAGARSARPESSAVVAARVAHARDLQWRRQGMPNAALPAARLDGDAALLPGAWALLRQAAERLGWSGRRLHRIVRVSRTIADLAGAADVGAEHVGEAVQYRRALPGG